MMIKSVSASQNWKLEIIATDGRRGEFDVKPYLAYEAFNVLQATAEFIKVTNGGYFVEWQSGADLSADTIEAKMVAV